MFAMANDAKRRIPYDPDIAFQRLNGWVQANLHAIYGRRQRDQKPDTGWVAQITKGLGAYKHLAIPVEIVRHHIVDDGMPTPDADARWTSTLNYWRSRKYLRSTDAFSDVTNERVNRTSRPCIVFYTYAFVALIKRQK